MYSVEYFCRRLKIGSPWDRPKPIVPADMDEGCFGTRAGIAKFLRSSFLVLEIGSWLGASTRFFAKNSSFVISVDHWLGNKEHQPGEWAESRKLQTLYETFIANCWENKDKILPIRTNSRLGMKLILDRGVVPDFVYVDGDHSYKGCMEDIIDANKFGRHVVIAGDDFDYAPNAGVKHAVLDFAKENNKEVYSEGNFWVYL